MNKWLIDWHDEDGNWIDSQYFEGDIKSELKRSGHKFNGSWHPTSIVNPLCLSYHGGWIVCRSIFKNKKRVGCVYSQDETILPKPKQLSKNKKLKFESVVN
jgi:hypothetical protein